MVADINMQDLIKKCLDQSKDKRLKVISKDVPMSNRHDKPRIILVEEPKSVGKFCGAFSGIIVGSIIGLCISPIVIYVLCISILPIMFCIAEAAAEIVWKIA